MKSITKFLVKNSRCCFWFNLWFLFCGTVGFASDMARSYAPYPQPNQGYVTDLANLLTTEQEEELESWLYTCEKEKGIEIAVVTINSITDYPGTSNGSIEEFATDLFNTYGIGNMPKNNGMLLLVAVKDRKVRIELGAHYGHEYDSNAERIMQDVIIPEFKNDRYDTGIIKGTQWLILGFGGMILIPGWVKLAVAGVIILLIPICISLFRSGKHGWGWVCVGFIIILIMLLFVFLKRSIGSRLGVGGGFGGGSSGGGGATGSW